MHGLFSPIRFAWRALASRPAFTVVVVACLTLGIAVNTTLFAVFDAILWRPYDFRESERLVVLKTRQARTNGLADLALATFRDIERDSRTLSAVGGAVGRSLTITEGEDPERVRGASISASLFPMLGVRPQLGRLFRADEDAGTAPSVAILSDALWRRRYAADSAVVGRTIQVNGAPHTVVGVMPPRFAFPETHELWLPIGDLGRADTRDMRYVQVFARLNDETTIDQARGEFRDLVSRIERDAGLSAKGWQAELTDLRTELIPERIRLVVLTMMGAVTFVLLIACANVANLMLSRATSREREIAVRAALGAGRAIIVRQLLLEAAIMALVAGVVAIPLARLGLTLIDRGIPPGDAVPYYIQWRIDARVMVYTVVVSLVAALAFGLFPALQATGRGVYAALKEGGRGAGASRAKLRTRSALVVVEVALALVLLVGASLFVRSFAALENEAVGFDTTSIMTMRAYLPGIPYDSAAARELRVQDLLRRMRAIPGVQAATASSLIPLDGGGSWSVAEVQGREFRREDAPDYWWSGVAPQWSQVLGLSLVQGRDLTESEAVSHAPVAVIDDRFAQTVWPGQDPLGRQFRVAGDSTLPWFTVVGVTRHYRQGQLGDRGEDPPSVYVPLGHMASRTVGLMVRMSGEPSQFTAAMRQAVRESDASIPVYDVNTMEQVRALGFWQYGLFGAMFAVFGVVALVLAAIGVYGVISYGVAQRTREFGVRLALGAQRTGVLRMVVGDGVRLAGLGIGFGLIGAFGVTRVLRSLLVVSPTDPVSFVGVALFLVAVAVVAAVVPAHRATAVDPLVALRAE